ncbi:hypothetical protein B4U79_14369, partial [Dinothrombium tinctorium]
MVDSYEPYTQTGHHYSSYASTYTLDETYTTDHTNSYIHDRKGHPRVRNHHYITNSTNPKGTIYIKRPRQLHTGQPNSNTSTHSTRMILPICIRNSTVNPQQTRRSNCPCNINCNSIHHTNNQIKVPGNPILPNQPSIILSNNKYSNPTYMNRSPTRRRPIHPNRTNLNNSILHILHNKPNNDKPKKINANPPPPYSTLNPETSSDSPSAKSKGAEKYQQTQPYWGPYEYEYNPKPYAPT